MNCRSWKKTGLINFPLFQLMSVGGNPNRLRLSKHNYDEMINFGAPNRGVAYLNRYLHHCSADGKWTKRMTSAKFRILELCMEKI